MRVIYHGAGHGPPDTQLFSFDPAGGSHSPFLQQTDTNGLIGFVSAARDGSCAVAIGIGADSRNIVFIDAGGSARSVFTQEGESALYWPRLAPDGNRLCFLETPEQDYPPHSGGNAMLHIIERAANGWVPLSLSAAVLNAPFDWGIDSQTLFVNAADETVRRLDIDAPSRSHQPIADAFLPTVAPLSGALAFASANRITIRSAGGTVFHDAAGAVVAMAWAPDETALIYAARKSQFESAVYSFSPERPEAAEHLFDATEIISLGILATG